MHHIVDSRLGNDASPLCLLKVIPVAKIIVTFMNFFIPFGVVFENLGLIFLLMKVTRLFK